MPVPILPTKLHIPSIRGGSVHRPRLIERLDSSIGSKLILVSAPAGYGKSSQLAEWVNQAEHPATWLSLDPADNLPARFWAHFLAALRIIPHFNQSQFGANLLGLLESDPLPEHEVLFGALITEIAAIPKPCVLVLDDFHVISEKQIQDSLFFLLENFPSGSLHIVISSRSDPPWPLARLRVRGQLIELRAADLRFTREEASLFLNQVMRLELEPEEVAQLDQRTEGWIAGLQMAALSMQGREDIAGFLAGFTGAHRFVLDYLMEEVLNLQPPEILDFLLKTSILERLSGPLCAAVTGDEASTAILLQLEKSNMFLVALDDQRTWYRYHHLFADLLKKQLGTRQPGAIPKLQRQASQWYAQAGFGSEAVAHAIKTGDWDFAATQVETQVLTLIQRGEFSLTQQWMRSLPEDAIRPRPILCIAQAWTSARYGTVAFAEELLSQAEAALSADPSQSVSLDPEVLGLVSSQIAVLKVVIARARGDTTQRQQELALEALERIGSTGDSAARATLFFRLGLCYLDLGRHAQADRIFSRAYELGLSSGNQYALHTASYGRMVISRLTGQLHTLAAICRRNLDGIRPGDESQQPLVGIDLTMMGVLYYEWNQLEQAEDFLTQGLELVEKVSLSELLIKGHYAFACLKIAQEDFCGPPDLVGIADRGHPALNAYAAALQARIGLLHAQQIAANQLENGVSHWAEKQDLNLEVQSTYDWDLQEKLVYTRVLCWQYQDHQGMETEAKLREALDLITCQRQRLEDLGWYGTLIELECVRSLVLQTLGRNTEAVSTLESALSLGKTQGFVRTFLDEGQPMKALLQQMSTRNSHSRYVQVLLTAFAGQESFIQTRSDQTRIELIDPLSKRELQVLRLLNSHLSVPQIADEIHLAPTTLRTHVQNIYRKLGVHNRIAALQRAEELGLI